MYLIIFLKIIFKHLCFNYLNKLGTFERWNLTGKFIWKFPTYNIKLFSKVIKTLVVPSSFLNCISRLLSMKFTLTALFKNSRRKLINANLVSLNCSPVAVASTEKTTEKGEKRREREENPAQFTQTENAARWLPRCVRRLRNRPTFIDFRRSWCSSGASVGRRSSEL